MKRVLFALFAILFFVAVGIMNEGTAWGQSGSATIRGTVTDPQGNSVPNAKVTLRNIATNWSRTLDVSNSGVYNFELIPVGDYELSVEAQGFRRADFPGIHALVGNTVTQDVKLEIGSVAETVEVQAVSSAVQLNTEDASLGNNIESQQILSLPLEARNVQSLLTLQPGVTRDGYVTGARSDQSNITLDGIDINEAQTNDIGSPVLRLNTEAVEEFRVTTMNANANQGRSSAAQINLVTKSGTNSFHGSLFEYNRNTSFTANDFFNNKDGVARPKLIRNTYGGTFGGPVIKDKVFFFYSYEARHDASATAVTRTVPLASLGQGQMVVDAQSCTDTTDQSTCGPVQRVTLTTDQLNQIYSSVGINPAAVAVLNGAATKYVANDTTLGDGINTSGFRFNANTPVRLNSNVAKVDWSISKNMNLSVRANAYFDHTTQAPQFPDTLSPVLWEHPWGGVISHNWTIGQNWVNSFRYGYTRQAFTQPGDSAANDIEFRYVYSPLAFTRTIERTTPVTNIVNDTSWIHGKHTVNFGTNIRIIKNGRTNFGSAYDFAITNPSFYKRGGRVVSIPVTSFLDDTYGLNLLVSPSSVQAAGTALIGRFSEYTANSTYAADGNPEAYGTPTKRKFGTNDYDFYIQDSWKVKRSVTLNLGLRYGLSQPVRETGGFGIVTSTGASQYFALRKAGAAAGTPFIDPLSLTKAGGSGKGNLYNWDYNNFQPRVSVAWSPNYSSGVLHSIFGNGGKSVIRSGFAMTNDYYGQALAVAFDLNNTLGYVSNYTTPANTFNVTTAPGPLYTGPDQNIQTLPFVPTATPISFPRLQPSDNHRRIESGIDTQLQAPVNYQFNLTVEREFGAGILVQASYVGRLGRHLLASRDVMALNNLKDPKSGMDWYTAATMLEKQRQKGASVSSIAPIPWFENVLPAGYADNVAADYGESAITNNTQAVYTEALEGWGNDWTDTQDEMEYYGELTTGVAPHYFFNPQYGALSSWGTIGNSNYHGFTLSVRQRTKALLWDFNYTFSHSLDDASGLQTSGTYGSSFILNPIRQADNYATSDFDVKHMININAVYSLPVGRGHKYLSDANRFVDAVLGGWQLSGIYRWNTGLPVSPPYDDSTWSTNWNVESNTTQVAPVGTCFSRHGTDTPKLFGCNTTAAYQSFRNAYPGETGQRNTFRYPGYVNLDMGLTKIFTMPWSENHKLQFRWEVFNVTNTQHFGTIDFSLTGYGLVLDPKLNGATPPSNWSNFTAIQGSPRVMQVGLRYSF